MCVASCAVGAAAQTVLVRTAYLPPSGCTASGCSVAIFEYEPVGRALRGPIPVTDGTGAYLTPDGSLLVAFDPFNPRLVVFDRAAGGEYSIARSPAARAVVGNPVRPEVYTNDASGAVALSVAGARRLNTPVCSSTTAASVSADGRRVAYSCYPGGGNPGYTAVVDAGSSAVISAVPFGTSPVLNGDGSALLQAESGPSGTSLRRYNTGSGTLELEVQIAPSPTSLTMSFDPRSRRVFLWASAYSGVFDENTLAKQTAAACAANVTRMVFERDRPRAFLVGFNALSGGLTFDDAVFCELDTVSLAVTASYHYFKPRAGAQALAMAEPPRAPNSLTAVVTGPSVSLSWQPAGPPAAINRYVLEVGSAPGLNDIFSGLDVGLQTSFGASNVPPGTYYVRVRAGNYIGLGAPSNEVVVQVP